MEKTLQAQYNLIKEGKGDKAYFLKSAYRLFPDMLSQVNSFEDTTRILKNRGIISENIGGLVTTGKKQDWHAIFNENMGKLKEDDNEDKLNQAVKYYLANPNYLEVKDVAKRFGVDINTLQKHLSSAQEKSKSGDSTQAALQGIGLFEGKEDPSKEVLDNQKHNFDYKDEKNYDNLFGQEFLKGYYTEMKDPKNADKDVEELRAIVAKNLAKDINFYVKDGQFGVKGLGYTTEAPGLGEPKEPKGKHAPSGYGDIPKYTELKESVLRLAIQDLIKETLTEKTEKLLKVGQYGTYNGQPVKIIKVNDIRVFPYATYDIQDTKDKITKDVDIDKVTSKEQEAKKSVSESLDKNSIKEEGERAKKEAMKKRITNEIVKRKKQRKALETLTELEEDNEETTKKLKELQSEIKQLEGMAAKLDGKKKEKVIDEGPLEDKEAQLDKAKDQKDKEAAALALQQAQIKNQIAQQNAKV